MAEQSEKPTVCPNPGIEGSTTAEIPERRKVIRYPFIATAEVTEIRTQASVTGRCSDLSEGGCYVDTLAPFLVNSVLRITIQHASREFRANAVAVYAHPSMGMGIKFTEIEPESINILCYWLADLRGEPIPAPTKVDVAPSRVSNDDADANVRMVLNELITILVRKKILTEIEGAELLFRTFR